MDFLPALIDFIDGPHLPFDGAFVDAVEAIREGRFADLVNLFGGGSILSELFDGDILNQVRDFLDGPDPN